MKKVLLTGLLCFLLGLPGMVMSAEHEENTSISLYGRLWPKVTYSNPSEGDPSTDITDAISRVGVAANYKLTDTLTAVALMEARVNLNRNGDGRKPDQGDYFLTENLGYVGLESSNLGLFAIGTQWNPYYNIVAAVTDVYYHSSSPFGYDEVGPFREEKLVRYTHSFSGLNLDLAAQMKNQNEGDEDYDKVYAGVGYTYGPVYVGVAYLGDASAMEHRDYVGIGASLSLIDDLYIAVTFQSLEYDESPDRETWDVAATYSFGKDYTLIGGVFVYDDDVDTSDPQHTGYNLTLVKALTGNVKVFTEWLRKDYSDSDQTDDQFSLGIRIDFNAQII